MCCLYDYFMDLIQLVAGFDKDYLLCYPIRPTVTEVLQQAR